MMFFSLPSNSYPTIFLINLLFLPPPLLLFLSLSLLLLLRLLLLLLSSLIFAFLPLLVLIAQINCDTHGRLCQQAGIRGYPSVIFYPANGKVVCVFFFVRACVRVFCMILSALSCFFYTTTGYGY